MRRKLTEAMQAAQKARDSERLATLRLILAAIKDRDIAHRGSGRPPVEDSEILEVLARMVRQRKESAKAYEEGGRPELAAQERREIDIIEAFLPEPMSEEEIAAAAASAIEEAEAAGPADMGRVMNLLKSRYSGRMDFGRASARVRALLT